MAVATVALRVGQSLTATRTGDGAFRWAFLFVAVFGVISVGATVCFPRGAGRELTGARGSSAGRR